MFEYEPEKIRIYINLNCDELFLYTEEDLASECGVSVEVIKKMLKGSDDITLSDVKKVFNVVNF